MSGHAGCGGCRPVVPQTFMLVAETAGIKVGEFVRDAAKMAEVQALRAGQMIRHSLIFLKSIP
jgi:hypothetical protein